MHDGSDRLRSDSLGDLRGHHGGRGLISATGPRIPIRQLRYLAPDTTTASNVTKATGNGLAAHLFLKEMASEFWREFRRMPRGRTPTLKNRP